MRIVVIDAQEDDRTSLAEILRREGHKVVLTDCGRAGLHELRSATADVLITEVLLPSVDGLEVIKAVRGNQPNLWIVALSGGGKYVSANMALTLARAFGADRILYKPFENQELLEAIERK